MQFGRHLENPHLSADFDEIWYVGSIKGPDSDGIVKKVYYYLIWPPS